ncbi:hypothetical protein B0H16DRAFT_1722313 [Mycena metata]|uniref:Uncharacterized protein n=1 Tax=Mycena metata TaxID=1033252 RepID=A0AAD7J1R4_9AGAR|nr:hypothetical protein B0H16DRAFT_1722313 [Mycena metata]
MLFSQISSAIGLVLGTLSTLWRDQKVTVGGVSDQWWAATVAFRRLAGVKSATGPCKIVPEWYNDIRSSCEASDLATYETLSFASTESLHPTDATNSIILPSPDVDRPSQPLCAASTAIFPSDTTCPALNTRPVLMLPSIPSPILGSESFFTTTSGQGGVTSEDSTLPSDSRWTLPNCVVWLLCLLLFSFVHRKRIWRCCAATVRALLCGMTIRVWAPFPTAGPAEVAAAAEEEEPAEPADLNDQQRAALAFLVRMVITAQRDPPLPLLPAPTQ